MNFNIIIDINATQLIFAEFTRALQISLNELGHTVDYVGNRHISNEIVILIISRGKEIKLNKTSKTIMFYFEQMDWNNASMFRSKFNYVFDLYKPNCDKYDGIICPVGWSEAFESDINANIENDCFLFGRKSDSRSKFLDRKSVV